MLVLENIYFGLRFLTQKLEFIQENSYLHFSYPLSPVQLSEYGYFKNFNQERSASTSSPIAGTQFYYNSPPPSISWIVPFKEYKDKRREVGGLLLIKLGKEKNKLVCFWLRINYKTKNYCSIAILVPYLKQQLWCPNIFNFTLGVFPSHYVRNWIKNQEVSASASNRKLLQWLIPNLLHTDSCRDYYSNTWALTF